MKLILTLSLCFAVSASAAMLRVTGIENGRTIVVDRNGTSERITLAGVAITDDLQARELLRWTLGSKWVLVESTPDGAFLVYRSPDALFVNRELVTRGYARATLDGIEPEYHLDVTYLGTINPAPRTTSGSARNSGSNSARPSKAPRSRPAPASHSSRSSGRGRPARSSAPSSAARTSDPSPRGSSR